ncbi:Retron-type RNA-directed DNA polymerase [hydrothermal vent metagenome]|uniref:Retron-type RNA-directed DNA polymerase n=1 Tax=hydrothermal vent metagenome TaxID=652676 RepID=A0A3B1CF07_9ZZZZ
MTLDGLEQLVKDLTPRRTRVNFIRYADDFIVTAKSKKLLEEVIKPEIERFLRERGLELSPEKTIITHIKKDGFTFLGQTFLKTGNKLRITPAKEAIETLIKKVGIIIRNHQNKPMEALVKAINPVLNGWANYHRHVVSSKAFRRVDTDVYGQLWRMLRRRHSSKSKTWLFKKYWTATGKDHVFSFFSKYKKKSRLLQIIRVSSIKLSKHLRIRVNANPYMPEYSYYFWCRRNIKGSKLMGEFSNQGNIYSEMKALG